MTIDESSSHMLTFVDMPEWRNGRRTRLKIWRWQHRAGSSPASGTTEKIPMRDLFYCLPSFYYR